MVEKKTVKIKPWGLERCLHIYLPKDYAQSKERYPVLYMFDGHNLFEDQDATYGYAWHLQKQFDEHHVPLIVIGLECNHEGQERLNEFCPYPVNQSRLGKIDGRGNVLFSWMTSDLKTWVEETYRTNGTNYIAGSSMGGLMALYGVIAHGDVYSGAACLSSSIFLCLEKLREEIRQASFLDGARIYLSYGSKEVQSSNTLATIVKNHCDLARDLEAKGAHVYFDMVVGGKHQEATWEKQVMTFVDYLGVSYDD